MAVVSTGAAMSDLKLARVVGVHPGGHAVDLVFLDDGARVPMVQVMAGTPVTTNTGQAGFPEPTRRGERWDAQETGERDMIAVVGFYRGLPIVTGFLYPQVSEMLFADPERVVNRTPSDVYTTTDKDGNTELYHPSGTYLRIGTTPAHEDLTGQDADGKWKIRRNTDTAVHVHLEVAKAGTTTTTLDIDPDGNVSVSHDGDLSLDTGGNIDMQAGGNIDMQAGGNVTIVGSRVDLNP